MRGLSRVDKVDLAEKNKEIGICERQKNEHRVQLALCDTIIQSLIDKNSFSTIEELNSLLNTIQLGIAQNLGQYQNIETTVNSQAVQSAEAAVREAQNYRAQLEGQKTSLNNDLYSFKQGTGNVEKASFLERNIKTKSQLINMKDTQPGHFVKCLEDAKKELPLNLAGDFSVKGNQIMKDGKPMFEKECMNIINWICTFPHYPLTTNDLGISVIQDQIKSINSEKFNSTMRIPEALQAVKIAAGFDVSSSEIVEVACDDATGEYILQCAEQNVPLNIDFIVNLNDTIQANSSPTVSAEDSLGMLNSLLANKKFREAFFAKYNVENSEGIAFVKNEENELVVSITKNKKTELLEVADDDGDKKLLRLTSNDLNDIINNLAANDLSLTKVSLYDLATQLMHGSRADNIKWDLQAWQAFCENATTLVQNSPKAIINSFGAQIAQNFFRFDVLYNNGVTGINLVGANGNTIKLNVEDFLGKIYQIGSKIAGPINAICKALDIKPSQFSLAESEIKIERLHRHSSEVINENNIFLEHANEKLLFRNLYSECQLAIKEHDQDIDHAVEAVIGVINSFKENIEKSFANIELGKAVLDAQKTAIAEQNRSIKEEKVSQSVEILANTLEQEKVKENIDRMRRFEDRRKRGEFLDTLRELLTKV